MNANNDLLILDFGNQTETNGSNNDNDISADNGILSSDFREVSTDDRGSYKVSQLEHTIETINEEWDTYDRIGPTYNEFML
jgi:hypothetical protein